MTRPRTTIALLGAATLLAGCGLPDDRTPRIIAAEEAPLDLSAQPGNVATTAAVGDDEVEIYLVREGQLEATTRSADEEDLATAIGLLLAGPTEAERQRGFSSSIPSLETELNSAAAEGGTAVIDLGCVGDVPADSCGVLAFTGQEGLLIFGQLTCTAMEVPGVTGVRFLQEGDPQDAPTVDGTAPSPQVVTCDDYDTLLRS